MSAAEGYVMSDRQIETNRICDLQWPIRWPDRSQTRAAVIYYTLGTDLPPPNLLVHGNVLVYTFNQTAVGVIVFVLMCDKRHLRATVYADEPLIHPPPHVDDVKDYYADVLAANYGRLRLLCPVPQCRRFLRRHFEGEIDERLIASIEFAFDDDEAELGIKVYPELQPGADLACGSFVDTKDQVSRMHEYARARTDTLVGTVLYMNPSKDFNGCGAVMRSIYELWSTHAVDINVYAEVTRCAGAQCVYPVTVGGWMYSRTTNAFILTPVHRVPAVLLLEKFCEAFNSKLIDHERYQYNEVLSPWVQSLFNSLPGLHTSHSMLHSITWRSVHSLVRAAALALYKTRLPAYVVAWILQRASCTICAQREHRVVGVIQGVFASCRRLKK
jgi:hypothetical protein